MFFISGRVSSQMGGVTWLYVSIAAASAASVVCILFTVSCAVKLAGKCKRRQGKVTKFQNILLRQRWHILFCQTRMSESIVFYAQVRIFNTSLYIESVRIKPEYLEETADLWQVNCQMFPYYDLSEQDWNLFTVSAQHTKALLLSLFMIIAIFYISFQPAQSSWAR